MITRKPKRRGISKKGVREFLNESQWNKDEDLSTKFRSSYPVYTHPDGRVLVVFSEGRGCLYPSRDEYDLLLQIIEANQQIGIQHILEGRLPQGKDFPEHVPQLINELASLLKIPRAELDGTPISLQKVDPKVKRLGKQKCLEVPIFPALVAYVGEVMRLDTGGKWDMRLDTHDGKTWEPWILDPQGRSVNPFIDLYDMLYEGPVAIYASTIVRIAQRRMLPPPRSPRPGAARVILPKKSDDPPT